MDLISVSFWCMAESLIGNYTPSYLYVYVICQTNSSLLRYKLYFTEIFMISTLIKGVETLISEQPTSL